MRSLRRAAASLVVLALCAALGEARTLAAPKGRFLVLGFSTKQMNDIQDRLLRESLMRRLAVRGFRIVPVMEVESLLQGEHRMRVRGLTRGEVKGLGRELNADYACYGTIESEGKREDGFLAGRSYRCSLVIHRLHDDAFETITVTFAGRDNLFELFEELSETLASRIEGAL